MIFICILILLIILLLTIRKGKKRKINFDHAKVLILGGTSGLGSALAHILHTSKADVTISARNQTTNIFRFLKIDVTDITTFNESSSDYDFIFCCAGGVVPGFFKDINIDVYREQMTLNYLGTLNALSHFSKTNKKPFSFIMIASTVALFTFPGYSAYAPTKCALKSFYDSAVLELKRDNIDLYIFYVNSMQTPGFDAENRIKPEFTKSIEGTKGMCPKKAARILLREMEFSNEICSDNLTRIFKLRVEIENYRDYFFMIVSLFAYPIIKWYVKNKFNKT